MKRQSLGEKNEAQKAIATLFDIDRTVITKHLKNRFESAELQQDQACAKSTHTAEDRLSN